MSLKLKKKKYILSYYFEYLLRLLEASFMLNTNDLIIFR